MKLPNCTVQDYVFLKTAEECGEAVQAISKMFTGGVDGTYEDGTTNHQKVAQELADVSTFIALLIDMELIDNKLFWASHEKKAKKITEKIEAMIKRDKEKTDNNDSDGRKDSSSGQPGDSEQ